MAGGRDFPKGVLAGVVAGLAAAFVMNEFQSLWSALTKSEDDGAAPTTLKAADRVSEALAGEPVPAPARDLAASSAHYLTGAVMGGLYGAAAEYFPGVTKGVGAGYGGAAWLAADEVIVPLLGLAPRPSKTKLMEHAYGFASHAVYGFTLEFVRRTMATVLSPRLLRDACARDAPADVPAEA